MLAGIASVGGAIAGAGLHQRYQLHREERLGVTLYSEPNYRGLRQTLMCAKSPGKVHSLSETRLPRVASIRVQRFAYTFRPALGVVEMLWAAVTSIADREDPEAAIFRWVTVVSLFDVLNPSAWRVVRDPAGDKQSWVRLWADQPTYPLPPPDEAARPDREPWHDILTDTPDVGPWSRRTRYLELGVGNPNHLGSSGAPGFDGGAQG
ncbi:hypothetical protein [Saccharopolyspora soli]|uniref:hypothetical protein n=1 Tax=Saccharopolyspora soli TaxID=2926618 RepID=UPI001F57A71C|nr:hypothetical protein [Saccharopolyspora soli]